MFEPIITIFLAVIISMPVFYLLGFVASLLQYPGLLIKNYYISKYYQITIGILSNIFQIYLLCSIQSYYFNYIWQKNLPTFVVTWLLLLFYLLTSIGGKHSRINDSIEQSLQDAATYTKIISFVPMSIAVYCAPQLIWETPFIWLYTITDWILNIPVLGFIITHIVRLCVGGILLMILIAPIVGLIKLVSFFKDKRRKPENHRAYHKPDEDDITFIN